MKIKSFTLLETIVTMSIITTVTTVFFISFFTFFNHQKEITILKSNLIEAKTRNLLIKGKLPVETINELNLRNSIHVDYESFDELDISIYYEIKHKNPNIISKLVIIQ